ncbi:MAG: PepSY domain-containing protein [Gammaproteobacteria bacterium]|nr:PepSY domain-containing protein [Gammaproteobacteria bacterium]
MRFVRLLHVYAGLALSLLLLALAVTGGALVYKEAYWRLVYPELRGPAPQLGAQDHAAAIDAALDRFGSAVRSVKLPEPGVPAYHVYLEDGEAFISADGQRVIDAWSPSDRLMSLLFDLHAHLMAGDAGERIVGILGLAASVMVVTGFVLWWPVRRRFAARHLWLRGTSRKDLLEWHRDAGALTSPVLLLVLLTGSGLVFYGPAQTILNGMFGDPAPAAAEALAEAGGTAAAPPTVRADVHMLETAAAAFPQDARLVFYYPSRGGDPAGFRIRQSCEMHPNGRSYLYFENGGRRVLSREDACAVPPGQQAVHAMYPLHAGKTGGPLYKLAVFLSAVALAGLSATGVATYLIRLRRTAARNAAAIAAEPRRV